MKVDETSPWFEHKDKLKELEKQAKALNLSVELPEHSVYLDAGLHQGNRLVGWVHYDPNEDGWAMEKHERFFCPLADIFESLKDGTRELVIRVSYEKGELPEVTKEAMDAIKKLLPGNPTSVTAS